MVVTYALQSLTSFKDDTRMVVSYRDEPRVCPDVFVSYCLE